MISLEQIYKDDWIFKISELNSVIMVHSFHTKLFYSNIRFFLSESSAKNFIDYICLQTRNTVTKGL